MMQKQIVAPENRENIVFGFRMQVRRRVRKKRRVFQIRPVNREKLAQPAQIERPVDVIHIAWVQFQIRDQRF
jgi:hypothetical protein